LRINSDPDPRTKNYEIFAELDPAELGQLSKMAELRHVGEGEVLIQAGQPARMLYVLKEGGLMVTFPDGRAITFHKPGRDFRQTYERSEPRQD
jgi:signal-transduction protein with cAMP-binding, CBS, and nucleotidyltransferase domain